MYLSEVKVKEYSLEAVRGYAILTYEIPATIITNIQGHMGRIYENLHATLKDVGKVFASKLLTY